jgi:HK97 family phage portal protein
MTTAAETYYSDDLVRPTPGASSLSNPSPWFLQWAGVQSGIGPTVNEFTALNYLAVYSCVTLIAGTIASLPLITYRRSGRRRERASETAIYRLLHDEFNPKMSSPVARETMTGHLLTWGNEYAQIVWNKSGSEVRQINPLGPDCVCPELDDRRNLVYEVYQRDSGRSELLATLPAEEMLHVPALGFDGLRGYSPIRVARNAIRAGLGADQEAEQFINRGIRPPGAIKFPTGKKFADEKQAHAWRDHFQRIHASEDGRLKVVILEDGSDWVSMGIDPESAQLLESRKFTRGEIAGLYRVPPHLIGDVEKATSWGTGIGEQVDGFIKFTLMPWLVKKEKEYNRKLFGGSDELYCEHLLEGLERADITRRTEALTKQLQHGVISPNEWAEIENRNPHAGGDVWFYPLNLGRVDADGNDLSAPGPNPVPARPAEGNARLADSLRKGIVAAAARCLRKEAAAAKRAAQKPGEFLAWVDEFYAAHFDMVAESIAPLVEAWAVAFPGTIATPDSLAANYVGLSRADLIAAAECRPAELPAVVERTTARWLTERLAAIAASLRTEPTHA